MLYTERARCMVRSRNTRCTNFEVSYVCGYVQPGHRPASLAKANGLFGNYIMLWHWRRAVTTWTLCSAGSRSVFLTRPTFSTHRRTYGSSSIFPNTKACFSPILELSQSHTSLVSYYCRVNIPSECACFR